MKDVRYLIALPVTLIVWLLYIISEILIKLVNISETLNKVVLSTLKTRLIPKWIKLKILSRIVFNQDLHKAAYKDKLTAIMILGELGDRRAIEPLIGALCDIEIRKAASDALRMLDDGRILKILVSRLDNDEIICKAACYGLGMLGDQRAVEPLIKVIKVQGDSNSTVFIAAYCALGMLGDQRAFEALINAFDSDSDDKIRQAAAYGLGKLGDLRAVGTLINALDNVNKRYSFTLSYGDRAGFLNDCDIAATTTIAALGDLSDQRAVEPLIKALVDRDSSIRESAAYALGKLGNQRAIEPLIKALADRERDVRKASANALMQLGESKWAKIIKGDDQDFDKLAKAVDSLPS